MPSYGDFAVMLMARFLVINMIVVVEAGNHSIQRVVLRVRMVVELLFADSTATTPRTSVLYPYTTIWGPGWWT